MYGSKTYRKVAFDYYDTNPWLHGLKYLVMFNPVFSIPFNVISTVELFEKVKPLSFLVRNPKKMQLSPRRITMTRIAILFFMFLITLVTTDISQVLNIVGSIFSPILGLIIPVDTDDD